METSNRDTSAQTYDKADVQTLKQGKEHAAIYQGGAYFPSNRWNVEAKKNQPASDDQVTNRVALRTEDFGSEGFKSGAVASQTGFMKYLETRLISPGLLRRKVIEAIRLREESRQLLLRDDD